MRAFAAPSRSGPVATIPAPEVPAGSTCRADVLATVLFVAVGALLLAGRAWMSPVAGAARVVTGLVLFGGILVASVVMPVPSTPSRPSRTTTRPRATPRIAMVTMFSVGVVAVVGAAFVAGTPVPLATTPWVLPLSLLAAVAEEALFRRVAYGSLERFGVFAAVVGSAVLFAAVHAPLYGVAALPVDVGAGLVFGWQRWATASWAAPAATHAIANVVVVLR